MSASNSQLLSAFEVWMEEQPEIKSVVLFGSSARQMESDSAIDNWSDADLHVISSRVSGLEGVDWAKIFPDRDFIFSTIRPATGGVRKSTLFFGTGQIDLVVLPWARLRLARLAFACGFYPRIRALKVGLDEIRTCIQPGYRFLKGEANWGKFYQRVLASTTGVRLQDGEIRERADVVTADLLWILQKIDRGELLAAQHLLHRSLAETNFAFVREYRIRIGQPLPSFGLGRRAETILSANEFSWVRIDANLSAEALRNAAWISHAGLKHLMAHLVPAWHVSSKMEQLLLTHDRHQR